MQAILAKSAGLMLATRLIVNALGIISSLILIRILSPDDFGIAAIAMSLYSLVKLFGDFGLNTALIQKNKLERSDYDTGFTLNFIFALIACTVFIIIAIPATHFFEEPRLERVLYFVALLFLVTGLKNIKVVDFQIEMNFHLELKLQVFPKILSFFITLGLAFLLNNYWALILGSLFISLITVIQSYVMLPYKPSFSLLNARKMFNFSKWLMINNVFFYLNNKSIDLIVGKFISTSAAGLYSISKEMATLPASEVAAPINKATYPAYAKAKQNPAELRQLFYQSTSMITIIALPASLGLFSTAEFFVPTILGEQWLEAIPLVKLLSLFAFVSSISSNNNYVFLALGKSKLVALISLLRISSFFAILFGFGFLRTVEGPALALLITSCLNLVICYVWLKREIALSIRQTVIANVRAITSTFLMFLIVELASTYMSVNLLSFISLVFLGLLVYVTLIVFLWALSGQPESIEKIIIEKIRK